MEEMNILTGFEMIFDGVIRDGTIGIKGKRLNSLKVSSLSCSIGRMLTRSHHDQHSLSIFYAPPFTIELPIKEKKEPSFFTHVLGSNPSCLLCHFFHCVSILCTTHRKIVPFLFLKSKAPPWTPPSPWKSVKMCRNENVPQPEICKQI